MAKLRAGSMKVVEAPEEPKQKSPLETYASQQRAARLFGGTVLIIGFAAAYFLWPTGITSVPLAAVTVGQLLRALGAVVIAVGSFGLAAMVWGD